MVCNLSSLLASLDDKALESCIWLERKGFITLMYQFSMNHSRAVCKKKNFWTLLISTSKTASNLFVLYFRYHTGSLAFGALIIAIIQFIRFILGYIQRQLKKRKEARWAQIMLSIFQCCFWCLEKVLRYVNRQAYIEVHLNIWHSDPYKKLAWM